MSHQQAIYSAEIAERILVILEKYGKHLADGNSQTSAEKWLGRDRFRPLVLQAIINMEKVSLVLPAFPWKSVSLV